MQVNVKRPSIHTHEGSKACHINAALQLRRSVMACMLWENTFYESGISISDRIKQLVPLVDPKEVVNIARDARSKMNLRHVPLLIVREMGRHIHHKRYVSRTLQYVIQRPDELTEFLAIYWKEGRCPLSAKVKQGLAFAFQKFSEYQLAKYDREGMVKLRDVLFLCHSKPKDKEAEILYKKIVDRKLETPDTWEVALSAGENKKKTFERLMHEKKRGALAFLRNIRNMRESDVDTQMINHYAKELDVSKVLPFRFIAAAVTNPEFEPIIEPLLLKCASLQKKLPGRTALLIDVSGSMDYPLSEKSDMKRMDAACALAILLREVCESICVVSFSCEHKIIPPRHGFALRDAIINSQPHSSTYLGQSIRSINQDNFDRIIVVTDEQSHDTVPNPMIKGYMINVATYKNGIGYGAWNHIDGFSSAIVEWIVNFEESNNE